MDIVVTIPMVEYDNNELEDKNIKDDNCQAFWSTSKTPKNLNINDRVYFVKAGKVYSSMRVIKILKDSNLKCSTTGRTWSGSCQLIMDDFREEKIDIKTKGFQGFRYKWWED
jgi:hypothetical protein